MKERWKFHPWGRNAKAICERLESLITEIRLAQIRASDNASLTTTMCAKSTNALISAEIAGILKRLDEGIPQLDARLDALIEAPRLAKRGD